MVSYGFSPYPIFKEANDIQKTFPPYEVNPYDYVEGYENDSHNLNGISPPSQQQVQEQEQQQEQQKEQHQRQHQEQQQQQQQPQQQQQSKSPSKRPEIKTQASSFASDSRFYDLVTFQNETVTIGKTTKAIDCMASYSKLKLKEQLGKHPKLMFLTPVLSPSNSYFLQGTKDQQHSQQKPTHISCHVTSAQSLLMSTGMPLTAYCFLNYCLLVY
eukprot:Awhi_evm2s1013